MTEPIMSLKQLLAELKAPPWDLLLMGDGSGQGWKLPAGWAVVSIDRQSGVRDFIVGSVSSGTVNFAELEPYLHALRKDLYVTNGGRLKDRRRVLILSDSEVTVKTGNGQYSPSFNPDMWETLGWFRRQGYEITFQWVRRNSNPLTIALDAASKQGDVLYAGLEWLRDDLYKILPWEDNDNSSHLQAEPVSG